MKWEKARKGIVIQIILIIIISLFCCVAGLFSSGGEGVREFLTVRGDTVFLYGSGLYQNDSVSMVAQGKASDLVTLLLGIPLLAGSLLWAVRGSVRARLLLAGTTGYFLYTYITYCFLWMYNSLFLLYTALMGLSFFAFIGVLFSFRWEQLPAYFREDLSIRYLAGVQFFLAFAIAMLWLKKLVPALLAGVSPEGLDHYTSMIIQALDLGILLPVFVISGIQLIRRRPIGYLLTSIILMKGITLLLSILVMSVNMKRNGVEVSGLELTIFSLLTGLVAVSFIHLICSIRVKNEDGQQTEV